MIDPCLFVKKKVKRVQKYIENLDVLKLKNTALGRNNNPRMGIQQRIFTGEMQRPIQNQKMQMQQRRKNESEKSPGPVVVTTKWETF